MNPSVYKLANSPIEMMEEMVDLELDLINQGKTEDAIDIELEEYANMYLKTQSNPNWIYDQLYGEV